MRRSSVAMVSLVVALVAGLMAPVQASSHPASGGGGSSAIDLAVSVTGPATTPDRGSTFPVVLEVTNVGSESATDVSLSTYLGEALSLSGHTSSNPSTACALDEWGSLGCSVGTLAPGASTRVTLTLERVMARETWIDVWTASSAEESNWENNYGGIYIEADRSNPADVQVQMASPEQPEPGEEFTYAAVVTNRGPELARSVTFTQSLADGVDFVSVSSSDPDDECSLFEQTYDEAGFEGGPYTYREVRCTLGNMRFAEQTTITVSAIRNDPHELWSSAWVSTSSYDDNYENDWADASTAGHPSVTSDLIMSLTRSGGVPLVGQDFTYTLSVTNAGPASAPDVVAESWLPEQLALRGITPSRGGDVCVQGDYQGISCTFGNLAVGETTTVTIDVTRVGAREFWMGGSVWSSNSDPDYENNYIEDQVPADKSDPADISVSMDGPKDPAVGSNFDYTVGVTNNGPNPATSVSLVISMPEGTEFVSATSPDDGDVCTLYEETYDETGRKSADASPVAYTYREVRCELGTLVPAETATVTVTLTRTTDYEMWASAWASTASYDANYDNDYASVGSFGKTVPPCAVPVDSDGGDTIVCSEGRNLGGDTDSGSYSAGSEGGTRALRLGKGNDTITVRVPTHSKKHRRIVVNAGRGSDAIKLLVAPGAGNVTVILKGGAGRDSIEVFAPRPGKDFKLRMWGGRGNDTCSSVRGDRHRSRAC